MKKNIRKDIKKESEVVGEYINMFIEIDTEKRVICISDQTSKSGGGVAKRFRNKKDIMRIFGNYLFHEVDLCLNNDERK